jgi:hypothetical protein
MGKPKSVDEFFNCIIWPRWDPSVAFDEGSKDCLSLKPDLIRDSIRALKKRNDLSRYTLALTKIVRLSDPDDKIKVEWQKNLRHLRALLYTSPVGTERQRAKLIEIARNDQVVKAMRYALRQEKNINPRKIEPTWIAVLFAEGSKASIQQANRYYTLLKGDWLTNLRSYLYEAKV